MTLKFRAKRLGEDWEGHMHLDAAVIWIICKASFKLETQTIIQRMIEETGKIPENIA